MTFLTQKNWAICPDVSSMKHVGLPADTKLFSSISPAFCHLSAHISRIFYIFQGPRVNYHHAKMTKHENGIKY